MIPEYPKFVQIKPEHFKNFNEFVYRFEPYAEFSFPCLYGWDTNGSAQISQLNDNLVIKMPDYITEETFYSFIGDKDVDSTLDTLLQDFGKLELVPEVVISNISNKNKYAITEDRDQHDYVYDIKDQTFKTNTLKSRQKKCRAFLRNNSGTPEVRVVDGGQITEMKDDLLQVFFEWGKGRSRTRKELKHEEIALTKVIDRAEEFQIFCILLYINGDLAGFSINDANFMNYGICRFHKPLHKYKYIDTCLSYLAALELEKRDCKFISWEQDLGQTGLRQFKESYKPIKYLKKFTIEQT
jgi:hypothetical protein